MVDKLTPEGFEHFNNLVADILSGLVVVATLVNWLPDIAALASVVWVCIRIYETKTVQALLKKRRS